MHRLGDTRMAEVNLSTVGDDATVIRRSCRDATHFAIVFDRHAPQIHRYLARRAGRQAADDLLAETFLVAFAKRREYDPRHRDARPWLYGIATRFIAQHRRRERQRELTAPLEPIRPDHAEQVVADVTAESLRVVLDEAIAALPDGDRDVLMLIACEDLTYDEVARALEIPVGTVRSRMHRARASLRLALSRSEAAATYEEILSNE